MAHKLLEEEPITKKPSSFKFPHLEGKLGISLYLWGKEVFLGLVVSEVVIEKIIRKQAADSKVTVFPF